MPRVGSSSSRIRGSVASHLPITIFCWLPPESVETDLLDARAAHREPSHDIVGQGAFARESAQAEAGHGADRGQGDIVADRRVKMEAALLAILGHQRDAEAIGVGRRLDVDSRAVDGDLAAAPAARDAEDGFQDFGATGAEQAADAEDFAAPQLEADAVQRPPPAATAERVERQARAPRARPRPSGATLPRWLATMSRPTIAEMIAPRESSAIGAVRTRRPSRSTVTRSARSRTSSIRCEV